MKRLSSRASIGVLLALSFGLGCSVPEETAPYRLGAPSYAAPSPSYPYPYPSSTSAPADPPPTGPRRSLNDGAILYPLPESSSPQGLLRPSSAMPDPTRSAILSRATFSRLLPRGLLDHATRASFDDLAVVGVRPEACIFYYEQTGKLCKPQVRLVVQALRPDPVTGFVSATDGAIHITYESETTDFSAILSLLAQARIDAGIGPTPLGPHPVLLAEGLQGKTATSLRELFAPVLVDANIRKITAYDHEVVDGEHRWVFSALERSASGELVPMAIPTLASATSQTLIGTEPAVPLASAYARLSDGASSGDKLAAIVGQQRAASFVPGSAQGLEIERAFEEALRLEDPTRHSPANTDCVSCHVAEGARRIGMDFYGLHANLYSPRGTPLPAMAPRGPTNLHAFGYLGRSPQVTARVLYEVEDGIGGLR
jgi:hypothetical protein